MADIFLEDLEYSHSATETGDMPTISGLDNLKLSLYRRYITRKGSFSYSPSYGASLREYVNELSNLHTQQKIFTEVKEQTLAEQRVQSVEKIQFYLDEQNPHLSTISISLTPIGQRSTNLNFQPFHLPRGL